MEKYHIVIPIYSDPFLHPLHKRNKLSTLYVQEVDVKEMKYIGKPYFLNQFHPDSSKMMQDYKFLYDNKGLIITADAKYLQPIFSNYKHIVDIKLAHWWLFNKPMDLEVRNNAIDFLSNKYYNVKKLNEIIPLSKHKEYCDELCQKMFDFFKENIQTLINSDGWFGKSGGMDFIQAFSNIEKHGVKVSDDVCDIFDIRVKKHISDKKLYSNYNLLTTTGRPSNSFGTVNFAALPPEKRRAIVPENDSLVEFDFDAYHLRLIGNLIGFKFPIDISVHEYFSKKYDCSYEESKQRTFQILYGGIREEHKKLSGFFDLTYDYINDKWNEINSNKYVETNIYSRKITSYNLQDLNKNKLFNYLIQAYETELNIKKILDIQQYLSNKKTKLVLYGYDSFLFDFAKQDGEETLKKIKLILEDDCDLPTNRVDYEPYYIVKAKVGLNYEEMKGYTV